VHFPRDTLVTLAREAASIVHGTDVHARVPWRVRADSREAERFVRHDESMNSFPAPA